LGFVYEENAEALFTLAATAPHPVSFSLQAGDDGELFEIVDGKLFKNPTSKTSNLPINQLTGQLTIKT